MKRFRLLLIILGILMMLLGFVACNESDNPASDLNHNTETVSQTATGGEDEGFGPSPVPEPAALVLLGLGLVSLAGIGRKKIIKKDK